MSEHFLDRAQVRAAGEHVCREGVAQSVGRGVPRHAGQSHVLLERGPEAATAEGPAAARKEDRVLIGVLGQLRPSLRQVSLNQAQEPKL